MAYNYNLPQFYPNQYTPTYTPQIPTMAAPTAMPNQSFAPQQNNDMIWVMTDAAAESYPVGPNQKVTLWNSNDSVFYVKAADANGRPLPMKRYRYFEENDGSAIDMPKGTVDYISREEFENFKNEMKNSKPQYQKRPNNQKEG